MLGSSQFKRPSRFLFVLVVAIALLVTSAGPSFVAATAMEHKPYADTIQQVGKSSGVEDLREVKGNEALVIARKISNHREYAKLTQAIEDQEDLSRTPVIIHYKKNNAVYYTFVFNTKDSNVGVAGIFNESDNKIESLSVVKTHLNDTVKNDADIWFEVQTLKKGYKGDFSKITLEDFKKFKENNGVEGSSGNSGCGCTSNLDGNNIGQTTLTMGNLAPSYSWEKFACQFAGRVGCFGACVAFSLNPVLARICYWACSYFWDTGICKRAK